MESSARNVNTASETDTQRATGDSSTTTPVDPVHSLPITNVASTTPSNPADAGRPAHNTLFPYTTLFRSNTGNETLTGVTVTDPFADAAPVLIGGDTNANGKLDV